jgi:anti-anti-sigma regulatory factor
MSLERRAAMVCKIERVLGSGGFVVFRVSGRIDGTYVHVLQELTENEKTVKGKLALDLTEVTVVSLEAVRALTVAEANGIELRNCPAYVREWISQVRKSGLRE